MKIPASFERPHDQQPPRGIAPWALIAAAIWPTAGEILTAKLRWPRFAATLLGMALGSLAAAELWGLI